MKGYRRIAREIALQALYAVELSGLSLDKVLSDQLVTRGEDHNVLSFANDLAAKTRAHIQEIDAFIKRSSDNWEFERIATVDRLVLRMAICELLYFDDIPPKVSIDEAIEISKMYSTEQSGRFVNGILDSVLNDLKDRNELKKRGRGLDNGQRIVGNF